MNFNAHPFDSLPLVGLPGRAVAPFPVPFPFFFYYSAAVTDAADTDAAVTDANDTDAAKTDAANTEVEEIIGAKLKALVQLVLEFNSANSSALLKQKAWNFIRL
jgi:hypothetical protein